MSLSKAFTWGSGARTFLPKNCLDNVLTRRKIYALHVPSPSESEKRWSFFFSLLRKATSNFVFVFVCYFFILTKSHLNRCANLKKSALFCFSKVLFSLSHALPSIFLCLSPLPHLLRHVLAHSLHLTFSVSSSLPASTSVNCKLETNSPVDVARNLNGGSRQERSRK